MFGESVVDTYADDDRNGSHNNHMFIEHEDGTTAMYAHLVRDSVVVVEREWVEQGQIIALSGTSGAPGGLVQGAAYTARP